MHLSAAPLVPSVQLLSSICLELSGDPLDWKMKRELLPAVVDSVVATPNNKSMASKAVKSNRLINSEEVTSNIKNSSCMFYSRDHVTGNCGNLKVISTGNLKEYLALRSSTTKLRF